MRYSGTALTFQFAGILGGGIAPSVAVLLLSQFDDSAAIAWYWSGVCVLSLIAMAAIKDFHTDTVAVTTGPSKQENQ